MKHIFVTAFLIITCINYSAQQVLPLNSFSMDLPHGAYLKDLNSELDPYIGTYKANFKSNDIILYITKEEKKLEKGSDIEYYMDALIVKYIIKNSAGVILQDTTNNTSIINSLYSIATKPQFGQVVLSYYGTNCMVGWGKVNLKKINTNQISWEYLPNDLVISDERCPGNPDLTIYLPETKGLIFNKQ
ncbi:DUF6705 family protein [Chryseobacterium vrystaatense]|uniref:DUF6705 domain-containing protein n=1 Tax=Chryseobacterium vrystaatense TaxID=307480 RepID=A0A1M5IA95_9FLAO|nr:DUF6705 family protein [Chryseobacterium vrystaatense]SHG25294.1 hypothetical protein SAMN02787073_3803 [Chryseobacterium vrystaatense]